MDNTHLRLSLLDKGILLQAGPVVVGGWSVEHALWWHMPVILVLGGRGMKEDQEIRAFLAAKCIPSQVFENLSQKTTNQEWEWSVHNHRRNGSLPVSTHLSCFLKRYESVGQIFQLYRGLEQESQGFLFEAPWLRQSLVLAEDKSFLLLGVLRVERPVEEKPLVWEQVSLRSSELPVTAPRWQSVKRGDCGPKTALLRD